MLLLGVEDFQSQLLLTLKRDLTGAVVVNKWWGYLKAHLRLFAADFSRQFNVDVVAAQTALDLELDSAVAAGDMDRVVISKVGMACLLNKQNQALVVRARV